MPCIFSFDLKKVINGGFYSQQGKYFKKSFVLNRIRVLIHQPLTSTQISVIKYSSLEILYHCYNLPSSSLSDSSRFILVTLEAVVENKREKDASPIKLAGQNNVRQFFS